MFLQKFLFKLLEKLKPVLHNNFTRKKFDETFRPACTVSFRRQEVEVGIDRTSGCYSSGSSNLHPVDKLSCSSFARDGCSSPQALVNPSSS